MPRQMSPEREREYSELHAFLDFFATHVIGIEASDPIHPTNVGKSIVKEFGRSKALEGLKQAVNDMVEHASENSIEYVSKLDATLRERGIITLSEVRRRYAGAYKRILKRRKIKNATEYYLVSGVLADLSSSPGQEERAILEEMVALYEQCA